MKPVSQIREVIAAPNGPQPLMELTIRETLLSDFEQWIGGLSGSQLTGTEQLFYMAQNEMEAQLLRARLSWLSHERQCDITKKIFIRVNGAEAPKVEGHLQEPPIVPSGQLDTLVGHFAQTRVEDGEVTITLPTGVGTLFVSNPDGALVTVAEHLVENRLAVHSPLGPLRSDLPPQVLDFEECLDENELAKLPPSLQAVLTNQAHPFKFQPWTGPLKKNDSGLLVIPGRGMMTAFFVTGLNERDEGAEVVRTRQVVIGTSPYVIEYPLEETNLHRLPRQEGGFHFALATWNPETNWERGNFIENRSNTIIGRRDVWGNRQGPQTWYTPVYAKGRYAGGWEDIYHVSVFKLTEDR
ncbi:MAG: hypothetical protein WC777_01595 [Candidatus Gracilibacteria bacterium]